MIWIACEVENVEPLATRLRDRGRTVLLDRRRKLSRSAGRMSRSTALTYIPADCASTRWLGGSKKKQAAETANVAAAIEIDLSMW